MDREKQGVYGGEAWDAYKYGEVDKGHNILNRDYGYQKFDQVNIHALATDTLHIDNTNEEEQYSILDGIYNKF